MSLSINAINDLLTPLILKARNMYGFLDILPIIYGIKSPNKSLKNAALSCKSKPYERAVKIILQREFSSRNSKFLGVAIYNKKRFFGLKEQEKLLSIFSMQADSIQKNRDAIFMFWHMISHSIDCFNIRNSPKYTDSFMHGPMIPKRPAAGMALANLKADIYALLILSWDHSEDDINMVIQESCRAVLSRQTRPRAALSPLPLALEHIHFALETIKSASNFNDVLELARGLSEDISSAFDKSAVAEWFAFLEASQEMAWLGHQDHDILSAAIHSAEKSGIRYLAGEISSYLNVTPVRNFDTSKYYNPFLSPAVNNSLHDDKCNALIPALIDGVYAERSTKRLYEEAVNQTQRLLEGDGFGYCAPALIETARMIEKNRYLSGKQADQTLQKEDKERALQIFKNTATKLRWQDIYEFCDQMQRYIRKDSTLTFDTLYDETLKNPDLSSIAHTMVECRAYNEEAFNSLKHIKVSSNEAQQAPPRPLPCLSKKEKTVARLSDMQDADTAKMTPHSTSKTIKH